MAYRNKEDQRAYARKHYQDNKEVYKERARVHTAEQRRLIQDHIQQAKAVPCTDCGQSYPSYVMDFDHLRDKEGQISNFRSLNWSLKRVIREIEKCEVVCSNCHRERTHQRR